MYLVRGHHQLLIDVIPDLDLVSLMSHMLAHEEAAEVSGGSSSLLASAHFIIIDFSPFLCILSQLTLSISTPASLHPFKTYTHSLCVRTLAV